MKSPWFHGRFAASAVKRTWVIANDARHPIEPGNINRASDVTSSTQLHPVSVNVQRVHSQQPAMAQR